MLIFKCAIKAIHYGKLLTAACSHAAPAKLSISGKQDRRLLDQVDVVDERAPGATDDFRAQVPQHACLPVNGVREAVVDMQHPGVQEWREDRRRSHAALPDPAGNFGSRTKIPGRYAPE
jgi:hypothetical protein